MKVSRFFEKNILREVHIKVGFSVNQFCQFTARESRSKPSAGFLRNLLLVAKLQFILEVKNYARAKHQAARRWVSAVNHWGKLGKWEFLVCRDPQILGEELGRLV